MATATLPPELMRREDVKLQPGQVLCDHCTGKCCRYFALPIETPTKWKDFEFIRWYLLHGGCSIFVEDDAWYLCVHSDCEHLLEDNRCGIYETRPQICRDYSTKDCEFDDFWTYDMCFETPEQVWEYAEALLGPLKGHTFRTPEPALFPVV